MAFVPTPQDTTNYNAWIALIKTAYTTNTMPVAPASLPGQALPPVANLDPRFLSAPDAQGARKVAAVEAYRVKYPNWCKQVASNWFWQGAIDATDYPLNDVQLANYNSVAVFARNEAQGTNPGKNITTLDTPDAIQRLYPTMPNGMQNIGAFLFPNYDHTGKMLDAGTPDAAAITAVLEAMRQRDVKQGIPGSNS